MSINDSLSYIWEEEFYRLKEEGEGEGEERGGEGGVGGGENIS